MLEYLGIVPNLLSAYTARELEGGARIMETVAIAKVAEQRLDEALRRIATLLGGLDDVVPRGSRVLIKPNLTIVPTDRGVTHPELTEAVVRLVADFSPSEIVIAESSGDCYTSGCFRFQGLYRIAARYGAKLVDLGVEEGVRTPVPEGLGREYVMIPRAVVEADRLISLPVFKLWGASPMTLSLKNLFGLYGARYYGHNKNSDQMAQQYPHYGLPGEVGVELGVHQPTVAQSICAINSVVKTDLAIVDALEGSDGRGNWLRLDTLIAGRNPVATDTVGLAMAGFDAREHATFSLCAERGLGPVDLQNIHVVGRTIEEAGFNLQRLQDNVLEMPLAFCLNLLSTGELRQVGRALQLYGLAPGGVALPEGRAPLLTALTSAVSAGGYYKRALAKIGDNTRHLLDMIVAEGGTSGDLAAIRSRFTEAMYGKESPYYAPGTRELQRLGLAYAVEGINRDYYLLPEGLVEVWRQLGVV